MATSKPRFSITLDETLLEKILQYQHSCGIATQNAAVRDLVQIGLRFQSTDLSTKVYNYNVLTLTEKIDLLCKKKGISNRMQLSRLAGIPYTTLDSLYRIGCENIKLSTLKKLSSCLDVPVSYLVNDEKDSFAMHIGDIIMNYRKTHGLSQREFASKCGGLTNGYISMLENGVNPNTNKPITPSLTKLEMLANGMDITLDSLLGLICKPGHTITSDCVSPDAEQNSYESLNFACIYDQLDHIGKKLLSTIAEAILSVHSLK